MIETDHHSAAMCVWVRIDINKAHETKQKQQREEERKKKNVYIEKHKLI